MKSIKITYWMLGLFLSCGIAWCASSFFIDTLQLPIYSSELKVMVRPPESMHRHRSEGWGTSFFGKFDITGVEDISEIASPALAIWGDSYVEAFQVEQSEKIQEKLRKMVEGDKGESKNVYTIGIGRAGYSIADYYYLIPRYETICPSISSHFIILPGISDVLPDQPSAGHSVFQSRPLYQLVEKKEKQLDFYNVRVFLRKYGLDFIFLPARSLLKETQFRFSFGPSSKSEKKVSEPSFDSASTETAFHFILNALKGQTTKPLTFIYWPVGPPDC